MPKTAHRTQSEATTPKHSRTVTFPRLAGSAVPDAPQDAIGPPGCQGTLLIHIQLAIDRNLQGAFLRDCSPASCSPGFMHSHSKKPDLACLMRTDVMHE